MTRKAGTVLFWQRMSLQKYNIQTAETIWQAKKKCPDLVIVRPHHDLYYKYSKQVMDIYKRYTDYVESFDLTRLGLMLREVKDCSVTV